MLHLGEQYYVPQNIERLAVGTSGLAGGCEYQFDKYGGCDAGPFYGNSRELISCQGQVCCSFLLGVPWRPKTVFVSSHLDGWRPGLFVSMHNPFSADNRAQVIS